MSSATVMVTARARKKLPVTPVTEMSGRKTTTGVIVEPTSGTAISRRASAGGVDAGLAVVAVEDDVFDDDDGVIDDEADGCCESAEGHEVEAFADRPKKEYRDGDGDGDDEPGNERRGPVAEEEKKNDAGEDEAYEDGVAHACDALAHDGRLVVEGSECDARGERFAELVDLRGDGVGDGDGVAGRLAGDVEQDRRLAVRM